MTKHTKKVLKFKNKKNKTRKEMIVWKGGAWYSFFLPLFGYKSGDTAENPADPNAKNPADPAAKKPVDPAAKKPVDPNVKKPVDPAVKKPIPSDKDTDSNVTDKDTDSNVTSDPEPVVKPKKGKKAAKNVRELYKVKSDPATIDKEFYDNPNITTWCFDDPGYKPVGVVHVTSVVGINILRTYATTVRNIVGVKGTIDENMHRLRNEIYNEMENVMEAKSIDKICGVGVAFTKDSGSLILSAFGTALRKQPE